MARSTIATLVGVSIACAAGGDSLIPRGAEGITRADVSILIGGGLDRESPTALQLFCGDVARANRFESQLRTAVSSRLEQRGIRVIVGAKSGFGVAVFGRPVESGRCAGRYAVLIEFSVSNERYPAAEQPVAQRGVIETPTDANLEAAILERVLLLLDEALSSRRSG